MEKPITPRLALPQNDRQTLRQTQNHAPGIVLLGGVSVALSPEFSLLPKLLQGDLFGFGWREWLGGVDLIDFIWCIFFIAALIGFIRTLDRKAERNLIPTSRILGSFVVRMPALTWTLFFLVFSTLPALLAALGSMNSMTIIGAQTSPFILMLLAFLAGFLYFDQISKIRSILDIIGAIVTVKALLYVAMRALFNDEVLGNPIPDSVLAQIGSANFHLWTCFALWFGLGVVNLSAKDQHRLFVLPALCILLLALGFAQPFELFQGGLGLIMTTVFALGARLNFQSKSLWIAIAAGIFCLLGISIQESAYEHFAGQRLASFNLMNFDLLLAIAKDPISGFGFGQPLPFPHGHEISTPPSLMTLQNTNAYVFSWAIAGPFVASALGLVMTLSISDSIRLTARSHLPLERSIGLFNLFVLVILCLGLVNSGSLWNHGLIGMGFFFTGTTSRLLWNARLFYEQTPISFKVDSARIEEFGKRSKEKTYADVYGNK